MSFSGAIGALDSAITGAIESLAHAGELTLDRAALEQLHKSLAELTTTLQDDPFHIMGTIQQQSFGGDAAATTLSYHHGRAHQVMTDTLKGMVADLTAFATNLTHAAQLLGNVDDDSKVSLNKQQALVNQLSYLGHHSQGDTANNHSRNHVHNPWSPTDHGNGGAH